ncbi:MAG TPA: EF-hand domain-containing protein [Sphingomonas sp.]|jgi:hypothetical protein|nr:EF-hand domain-containing protein [Sphingomonas sp.]
MLFLALLLQAAPASPRAVPPGPPAQPPATILAEPAALFIAGCDANGEARVTRAELDACVARSFAGADGVRDGSVGYIGYADWCLRWLGDRNALPSPFEVDANGDNRVTLAELEAGIGAYFTRYDVDRDGQVTHAELITIRAAAPGAEPLRGRKKR